MIFIDLEVVVLQGVFMTEVYCLSVLYQMTKDCFSLYLCSHPSQQCINIDTLLFLWHGLRSDKSKLLIV